MTSRKKKKEEKMKEMRRSKGLFVCWLLNVPATRLVYLRDGRSKGKRTRKERRKQIQMNRQGQKNTKKEKKIRKSRKKERQRKLR